MDTQDFTSSRKPVGSLAVLGARVSWTLLGPAGVFFATMMILTQGTGWLTGADLAFTLIVGLILFGRWYEHRSGTATTLYGEPETPEQYRRFMVITPAVLVGIWIVANILGNHVFSG